MFGLIGDNVYFEDNEKMNPNVYLLRLFNFEPESNIVQLAVAIEENNTTRVEIYVSDIKINNNAPDVNFTLENTYDAATFKLETLTVSDISRSDEADAVFLISDISGAIHVISDTNFMGDIKLNETELIVQGYRDFVSNILSTNDGFIVTTFYGNVYNLVGEQLVLLH